MHRAFTVLALAFLVAAGYHAVAAVAPAIGIGGQRWRHVLFVAINLLTAWYLLRRPRWLLPAFLALIAQQVHSHGGGLVRLWRTQHRVDWVSALVLATFAAALALVLREAWARRRFPLEAP